MPKLSVWMVRAALIHMGIGFLFGSLILYNKGIPTNPQIWRLLQLHTELIIFGWTMQFVMGIAYWILPRFRGGGPYRYGKTILGWWAFALINGGSLTTAFGAWQNNDELALAGRMVTIIAVLLFVRLIWARVKPFNT